MKTILSSIHAQNRDPSEAWTRCQCSLQCPRKIISTTQSDSSTSEFQAGDSSSSEDGISNDEEEKNSQPVLKDVSIALQSRQMRSEERDAQ